jgi:hypothetical protein
MATGKTLKKVLRKIGDEPKKGEDPVLTPAQQQYLKNKYAEAAEIKKRIKAKDSEYIRMAKEFKAKYNESWSCPSGKCPPAEQQKPKETEEVKRLPILPAKTIEITKEKKELQGEYKEEPAPKYQMPGYKVERRGVVMRHGNRPTLTKVTRPGIVSKAVQKATGYNPKYSEGGPDNEGNYSSGEFENAETEGRRVKFKGASSLKDIKAQKEYNKSYDEYEKKKEFSKALSAGLSMKKSNN